MARLLIQSVVNGRFAVANMGGVLTTRSLPEALADGMLTDYEEAREVIHDHLDASYIVVDIDADYGE